MIEKIFLFFILVSYLDDILGLEFLYFIPWIPYLLNNLSIPLCWEQVRGDTDLAALHKRSFCLVFIKKHTCLRIFGGKKPQNVCLPRDCLKSQLFTLGQLKGLMHSYDGGSWRAGKWPCDDPQEMGLVCDLGPWQGELWLQGGAGRERCALCKGFPCFHCRLGWQPCDMRDGLKNSVLPSESQLENVLL